MWLIAAAACVLTGIASFTSCIGDNPAAHTHTWGEWTEVKAATCTESGEEERVCRDDSTHRETREIEAKGHTPNAAVKENEIIATCTQEGSYDEVVYCAICNEKLSSEHNTVERLAHDYVDGFCTVCGQTEPTIEHTHTYEMVTIKPTCIQQGYTTYTCTVCKDTYTGDAVAATGHTPKTVKENEIVAICTQEGSYDEVVYCAICNEKLSSVHKTVEKLPHSETIDAGRAATCTQEGRSEGKHCTVCGKILVEQRVIESPGHAYGKKSERAATCTEDGEIVFECTRAGCGAQKIQHLEPQGHDFGYDHICDRCGYEKNDPRT